jgi:V/A-type H+-transporting ATPase subunit I
MAILPVKKISMFFLKESSADVLSFLQHTNAVEILKNSDNLIIQNFETNNNVDYAEKMSDISLYISNLDRSIKILQNYETKKNFLEKLNDSIHLSTDDFAIKDENKSKNLKNLCLNICKKIKILDELESKKANLLDNIKNIENWLSINFPLTTIIGTNSTRTLAGTIPTVKYSELVDNFADEPVVFIKINQTEKDVYFTCISYFDFTKRVKEEIVKTGKLIEWDGIEKTPAEIQISLKKMLLIFENKQKKIKTFFENEAKNIKTLKIEYDKIYNEWLRYKKNEEMFSTENIAIISGWIPSKILTDFLKEYATKIPNGFYILEDAKEGENVPIAFENSKLTYPFEIITDLYGRPTYSGIDPTPFLAPFFFLFFGMCSADAGYGLVMIISALFALKFTKENPIVQKASKLFLYLGIATFSVGIITGSFFGNILNLLPQNLSFIKNTLNKLVLVDPLDEKGSLMFLVFALVFGYLQLCFGLCLKIYLLLRDKNYKSFFLEGLSALGVQLSLLPITLYFVLGVKFLPISVMHYIVGVFCTSVVLIGYNEWKKNEGIMIKMFWCLYGNYCAITGTFLADTLSYSRLFALGLSGGLLALAINEISGVFKNIPVLGAIFMIFVMLVGHGFNLAIGIMGAFVHSCRLQYLEFFTKFFESGGTQLKPFGTENKYTVLKVLKVLK